MSAAEGAGVEPADGPAGKDAALSEDIRLLGRLLGDVVREQAGDEVFELVEAVRRRAVDDRRDGRSPLPRLGGDAPAPVDRRPAAPHPRLRLAVAARQHRRGRPPRAPPPLPPGPRLAARRSAASRPRSTTSSPPASTPTRVRRLVDELLVVPVITAHPTEVRRQTVLDIIGEVARVLGGALRCGARHARSRRARRAARRSSSSRCGRRRCCACPSCASPTRSTRRCATTARACSRSSRRWSATSSGSSPSAGAWPSTPPGPCGWARGSAVTATATRSSPPTSCARRRTASPSTALDHHLGELRRLVAPAVGVGPPRHAHRRPARARRRVGRRLTVPGRRALPPRPARDVRPAVRARRASCSDRVPPAS